MKFFVTARSESGDDYDTIFDEYPLEKDLSEWCHSLDGDPDDKSGPGFDGSFIHIEKIRRI